MNSHISIVLAARSHSTIEKNEVEFAGFLSKFTENRVLIEEIADRLSNSDQTIIISQSSLAVKLPVISNLKNTRFKFLTNATQGALMSLGMALDEVPSNIPILVVPGDALIDVNLEEFVDKMCQEKVQVGLVTFQSNNDLYSYLHIDKNDIIEVVEKEVKGELATSGIYFFSDKEVIVECIEWALLNKVKVNNRYYLSTAINKVIIDGNRIGIVTIPESCYYRFATKGEAAASLERMKSK